MQNLELPPRSSSHLCADSDVEHAFAQLLDALLSADLEWVGADVDRARLEFLTSDMIHHLCQAKPGLTRFVRATGVERVLAHEAYLSALQILVTTSRAHDESPAMASALELVRASSARLLDTLAPYVSRADAGLRGTLCDGAYVVPGSDPVATGRARSRIHSLNDPA